MEDRRTIGSGVAAGGAGIGVTRLLGLGEGEDTATGAAGLPQPVIKKTPARSSVRTVSQEVSEFT
jgi:fructose-1-phosphate kinase PfkB-like protein